MSRRSSISSNTASASSGVQLRGISTVSGRKCAGICGPSGGVLMIWRRGAGVALFGAVASFLEAVGFAFDGDNLGVVHETVNQ